MTATTPHLPPGDPAYRTAAVARPVVSAPAVDVAAVSWPAIFAGAVTATALSLVLLLLGTGLQLSTMSPWVGSVDGGALSTKAILWLAFTQLAAAGTGGYMAGRLRGAWTDVQADEVFFRDTAHGLLAWGVATIGAAALLTTVTAGIAGIGVAERAADDNQAPVAAVSNAGPAASASGTSTEYHLDRLFRPQTAATTGSAASSADSTTTTTTNTGTSTSTSTSTTSGINTGTGSTSTGSTTSASAPAVPMTGTMATPIGRDRYDESSRIFTHALGNGTLAADDELYLAQMVSNQTGLGLEESRKRVADAFSSARASDQAGNVLPQLDDAARTDAARNTLWMVVALLIGAFTASVCALAGGMHQRRI